MDSKRVTSSNDPMTEKSKTPHFVDIDQLPALFPTHRHAGAFWESLGRAVATFGFLEEVLGKAIFSFTATRAYDESEINQAYTEWLPKLEHALIDPLGNLIDTYGKAVRENPSARIQDLAGLLAELRAASAMRNILCHGSWRPPDANDESLPLFVNRQKNVVETKMSCASINQVQRHAAELACLVVNTVTETGWRFPGSRGPGEPIW